VLFCGHDQERTTVLVESKLELRKERPQYSCNSQAPVKGERWYLTENLRKQFCAGSSHQFTSIRRRLVFQRLQLPYNYGCISCARRGLLSGCVAGFTEVFAGAAAF